jgi:RND family efflux transporter MFP subunit
MGIRLQRNSPGTAVAGRWPFALGAAIALAGALLIGGSARAAPVLVPTLRVQPGGTAAAFVLDGAVQATRQSTLAAQVQGNVTVLAVKAGDRVRSGQLIARIDERDAQAGLLRAQAGVAEARAQARNARLIAQRTAELRAQGFVSQAALDVAETTAQAAQSGLKQAEAAQMQAALARGFAAVTAPFDAVVLATHLDAGDLAAPGRAVATVYAPGAMRAVVQVPSSRANWARDARQVQVLLPDGRAVDPVARTVLPSADPVAQTVEWRLDLPAAALAGLLPGQSVQVRFAAAPAAGGGAAPLVVPPAAVLRRGELTAVYVVQGERFVLRAVRVGDERGAAAGVEVLAGLKDGERIAADAVKAGLGEAVPQDAASAALVSR